MSSSSLPDPVETNVVYDCHVSCGSRPGINWQPSPFQTSHHEDAGGGGADWPRNGALLKGSVYEADGNKWFKCDKIQQASTEGFKPVSGDDKWMPFDGGSGNGGAWLHAPAGSK